MSERLTEEELAHMTRLAGCMCNQCRLLDEIDALKAGRSGATSIPVKLVQGPEDRIKLRSLILVELRSGLRIWIDPKDIDGI